LNFGFYISGLLNRTPAISEARFVEISEFACVV